MVLLLLSTSFPFHHAQSETWGPFFKVLLLNFFLYQGDNHFAGNPFFEKMALCLVFCRTCRQGWLVFFFASTYTLLFFDRIFQLALQR